MTLIFSGDPFANDSLGMGGAFMNQPQGGMGNTGLGGLGGQSLDPRHFLQPQLSNHGNKTDAMRRGKSTDLLLHVW